MRGDGVFQKAGVGKVQAFINAQAQNARLLQHRVTQHVAVVLGARHLPHHRDVRAAGAVQQQQHRSTHTRHQTHLDPGQQSQAKAQQQSGEVGLGVAPGAGKHPHIDQREHSHHDGGRQGGLRQMKQPRREKQRRQRQANGRENASGWRACPCIKIDHRTRKSTGDRKAPGEPCTQVAQAQGAQLGIGVDAFTALGRQRLAHRHRLHKPHQRNQQCGHPQSLGQSPAACRQAGQRERRHALRHSPHHAHALVGQVQPRSQCNAEQQHRHRRGLAQHIGGASGHAPTLERGLELLARQHQQAQGPHAHEHSGPVHMRQLLKQIRQQLQQGLALQRHAQQMFELARCNQQARSRDKARDDRVA